MRRARKGREGDHGGGSIGGIGKRVRLEFGSIFTADAGDAIAPNLAATSHDQSMCNVVHEGNTTCSQK